MKPRISVIIPVYNTAKYLSQCLDSVLSQKFNDFEIILVDDGSTDRSGEICDIYATNDRRITVFHNENKGVSHSRNVGIDVAKGEWLMFVDSDDELSPNCFLTLSEGFEARYDMIIGGYEKTDELGQTIYSIERNDIVFWNMDTCLRDVYRSRYYSYNGFCANRLFRRSIVKKYSLSFNENVYSREDGLFLIQYLLKCSGHAYYTLASIYRYRQRINNATSSFKTSFNPKIITGLDSHLICIREIKKYSKDSLLLKYAQKGLITSFKWNYCQLRKYQIRNRQLYWLILKKLFSGVSIYNCVTLWLEDFMPIVLHPITVLYKKSNIHISYVDNIMNQR